MEQNASEFIVSKFTLNNSAISQWVPFNFRVKDFIENPAQVRFIIEACDIAPGHLLEAGLDQFNVLDSATVGTPSIRAEQLVVFPNPGNGSAIVRAGSAIASVWVMDLSGRMVCTTYGQEASSTLNLPKIDAAGTYLIQVRLQNGLTETIRWVNL
jgi:hypothetical protein